MLRDCALTSKWSMYKLVIIKHEIFRPRVRGKEDIIYLGRSTAR